MTAKYELWMSNPRGSRIALLDTVMRIEWATVINDIGAFTIVLPDSFDTSLLVEDNLLEFWRKPVGGGLSLENRVGFLRYWNYQTFSDGKDAIVLAGLDLNYMLSWPIVAYAAGSSQASKTDFLDDMAKDIVRENLGASATDTDRDLSAYGFSVAVDLGAAPTDTMAFSRRNVLEVLKDIAQLSRQQGTELYYHIVASVVRDGNFTFQFRTATGQLGRDRSYKGINPIVFGKEWNNLEHISLSYDYRKEKTVMYSGGRGTEADREVVEVEDANRSERSIWGRREAFVNATQMNSTAGYTAFGNSKLEESRPKLKFGGTLLDTEQFRYGLDWQFGDRVTARYRDKEFDGVVNSVNILVDENGQETIQARLEVEDAL